MKQAPLYLLSVSIVAVFSQVSPAMEVDEHFNPGVRGTVHAIAVAPDGNILVGGEFDQVAGAPRANVARVRANGTLDADFNVATDGAVFSLATCADGAVYGGGAFNVPTRHLMRLSAEGEVDPGLGIGASTSSRVRCLGIGADGALAFGGPFRRIDGAAASYIGKLTADGSLDGGFSSPFAPSMALEAGADAVAVQPDGKVLVGGNFNLASGVARLVRLNADGTLDGSFGGDHGAMLYPKAIVVLGDGRILVAGTASSSGDGFVRRLNADGSVDGTFQEQGFGGSVEAIAVTADGAIIAGGSFEGGVARLNADGTRDESWAVSANGAVKALAIESNGAVLLGGAFSSVGDRARAGLARVGVRGQRVSATNANGRFVARLKGEAGKSYAIEASTDLRAWSVVGEAIATSAGIAVTDQDSTIRAQRFFRARRMD